MTLPLCFASRIPVSSPGLVGPFEHRSFCRTIFGVRLCWELEETKGPQGSFLRKGVSLALLGLLLITGLD